MSLGTFLAVNLPYCIQRLPDGRYTALNREYKPVGFNTTEWIQYSEFPVAAKFRKIHPSTAKKLNVSRLKDENWIYLYNDRCHPLSDPRYMQEYLEKLSKLAEMKVIQ